MLTNPIGPWRMSASALDSVVAEEPTGHDSPDAVRYYGGHLVAESIPPKFRPLIAAAPDLRNALRDLVDVMTGRMEGETTALHNALAALSKADGGAPC